MLKRVWTTYAQSLELWAKHHINLIILYIHTYICNDPYILLFHRCTKFSEFFKIAYKAATVEPYAKQFKELSANGDREGMIKVLLDISCINNIKISESYRGKDDIKAAELYKKSRTTVDKNGMMHDEEDKSSILSETLFTASVPSRLFLDALLDCAQYCYISKAFVKCLKYCECMLALPENFYNKSVESMNNFLEYKNACIQLERECSKKLKVSSSQDKKLRKKCKDNPRVSSENKLIPSYIRSVPVVDGKQHAILKSCSDAVALQFDEERGRRLVATRNIRPGCVLIVERSFAFSTNNEALNKNCLHCHVTVKSNDSIKIPCYFCQTVSSSNNSNLSLPLNIGKVYEYFSTHFYTYLIVLLQVFYCSEKCRGEAWKSYHQYECSVFDAFYENDSEEPQQHNSHLLLAYRMTISGFLSSTIETINNDAGKSGVTFLNDNFLQHHVSHTDRGCNNLGIDEAYSSHDYRTILNLETHCAETEPNVNLIRAIEAIFLAKSLAFVLTKNDVVCLRETFISLAVATLHHLQALNCNAYEIVENVYDKNAHVWEPRVVGGAIYPSVSLVNHSCYPNIVRHTYPSGKEKFLTLDSLQFNFLWTNLNNFSQE